MLWEEWLQEIRCCDLILLTLRLAYIEIEIVHRGGFLEPFLLEFDFPLLDVDVGFNAVYVHRHTFHNLRTYIYQILERVLKNIQTTTMIPKPPLMTIIFYVSHFCYTIPYPSTPTLYLSNPPNPFSSLSFKLYLSRE